jgi:hypothetical protein
MKRDNDIRREVQSKLGDYRAPVPADRWDRIEQSLNAAKAARMIVRRRWVAGSAAAAVILLAGILLFIRPKSDETVPLVSESESTISPIDAQQDRNRKVEPSENSAHAETSIPAVTLHATKQAKLKGASLTAYDKLERIETVLQRDKTIQVKSERNINENDFSSVIKWIWPQRATSVADNRSEEEFITIGGEQEGLFGRYMPDEKERGPILLALNGRGGLTRFQQTVNSPMTLRSAEYADNNSPQADAKMILTANNTTVNVSEMEHDQPVSFGITLSKPILDNLTLETGLVYTYLSSKARNSSTNFHEQETQHLHYVGIPLNINYNLFSVKKIEVYASVGGMIEKDVYGEFRRTGEGQSPELNVSSQEEEITKISQANPQISVNAGIGISYPVYHHLKLYGKIGGAYYFDANNMYKTIYSDSKIVMDLNVGLRYEFK